MLQRFVHWYGDWEREMLAVLADPAQAATAPPGVRRRTADKLARLSAVERQQLRKFAIRYQGTRLYVAIGKLIVVFSVLGVGLRLGFPAKFSWIEAVLLANLLGFTVTQALVSIWFNYRRIRAANARTIGIVILLSASGAVVGASVVELASGRAPWELLTRITPVIVLAGIGAGLGLILLIGVVALWRNHEYEALTAQLQLEGERERMARQLSETHLRLMRAQIEPHFLFNTLGALQQLCETAPPRAAELAANLILFLRANLSEMRGQNTSLKNEFGVIEAYLKIMKLRLGERLQFALELPATLASVSVPSMVLLTLVENAIKHGIEPALRGGQIRVGAREQGQMAAIAVFNSGARLPDVIRPGLGLQHVRERLALLYAGSAAFSICNQNEGVVAEVVVPLAPAPLPAAPLAQGELAHNLGLAPR